MGEDFSAYFTEVEWCLKLSRNNSRLSIIAKLLARLEGTIDTQKLIALNEHLARQYTLEGRKLDARNTLLKLVALTAGSEMSFCGLASHFLYCEENLDLALDSILKAEFAAQKSGHFRRHVQAQKARITLALNDYEALNATLTKISEITVEKGQRDVKKERDFFDNADKSKLNEEIVKRFESYFNS
jgi:hypothetical protein